MAGLGGPTHAVQKGDEEDETSLLHVDEALQDDAAIPAPGLTPAARRRRYVQVCQRCAACKC